MNSSFFDAQSKHDFQKARNRELWKKLLSVGRQKNLSLLNLEEVRQLIKPKQESYKGLQVVPIKKIVGSEGRYRDFSRAFLPKYDYIEHRWVPINTAHLKSEILPPIKLYKIGDAYFVRDGNHRVSVAASQGSPVIDAEVIELGAEVEITAEITIDDLKKKVIAYEREQFFKEYQLDGIIDRDDLTFSATGRYGDIADHIKTHKYFLDLERDTETPLREAAKSWHETVFLPIIVTIQTENLLALFPGRTRADLYVWIVRHWDALKKRYGSGYSIYSAAKDFTRRNKYPLLLRIGWFFKQLFRSGRGDK